MIHAMSRDNEERGSKDRSTDSEGLQPLASPETNSSIGPVSRRRQFIGVAASGVSLLKPLTSKAQIKGGASGQTSTLTIVARDDGNNPLINAKVVLYRSDWSVVGSKRTDSSGKVSWSKISTGSYKFEVYGSEGDFLGAEVDTTVNSGGSKTNFRRKSPKVAAIKIEGEDGGDSPFKVGKAVTISPKIENNGPKRPVRVKIQVDTNSDSSPNIRKKRGGRSSTVVPRDGTQWYGYQYSPSSTGTKRVRIYVETYLNDKWVRTDHTNWTKPYSVGRNIAIQVPTKKVTIDDVKIGVTTNIEPHNIKSGKVKYEKKDGENGYKHETGFESQDLVADLHSQQRIGQLRYKVILETKDGIVGTKKGTLIVIPEYSVWRDFIVTNSGPERREGKSLKIVEKAIAEESLSQLAETGTKMATQKLASKLSFSVSSKGIALLSKFAGLSLSLLFSAESVGPPTELHAKMYDGENTISPKGSSGLLQGADELTIQYGQSVGATFSIKSGQGGYSNLQIATQRMDGSGNIKEGTEETIRKYEYMSNYVDNDADPPPGTYSLREPINFSHIDRPDPGETQKYQVTLRLAPEISTGYSQKFIINIRG